MQYIADGDQNTFPFIFPILQKDDLDIYIEDQKQVSNYTVSGEGETNGGTVLLSEVPIAGAVVTLLRNTPIERVSDFQQSGKLQAKVLNDELDRLTAALQDVAEKVRRSVKLTAVDSSAFLDLPECNDRADKLLGFDSDGNVVAVTSTGNGSGRSMPGGMDGQVQFNEGGDLGGAGGLNYAKTTATLTVSGGVKTDVVHERTGGAGVVVDGVVIRDGLVDGRDVSADGAKLDGVASDAIDTSGVTFENLSANGDIGTAADQVAQGNHVHTFRELTETPTNFEGQAGKTFIVNGTEDALIFGVPAGGSGVTGWINARDYGAVGDGESDDTAAIVSALAAGKFVVLPAGTYYVTATIYPQAGQRIFAYGALLKVDESFLAGNIDTSTANWNQPINPVVHTYVDDVEVYGLTVKAVSGGSGGDLTRCQAFFTGLKGSSEASQSRRNHFTLKDVVVAGNAQLASGFVGKVEDLTIAGCRIQDTTLFGLHINHTLKGLVTGNTLEYIGVTRPVSGKWPDDGSIWNNTNALRANDSEQVTISENIVKVTGGTAVMVESWEADVRHISCVHNQIFAAGHSGIDIQRGASGFAGESTDITISSNQVFGHACSPGSAGHPSIAVGDKGADGSTFKARLLSVDSNILSYLSPYETFDAANFDTPTWVAGSGTHNPLKGKGGTNNGCAGIQISGGGAVGADSLTIRGNVLEYFPLSAVLAQKSRNVGVEGNVIRWCGWGRDDSGNQWDVHAGVAGDDSVNVIVSKNIIANHGAGGNKNGAFAPFRVRGAAWRIEGNTVDNSDLGIHGAEYYAQCDGEASGVFVLDGATYTYSVSIGDNTILGIDKTHQVARASTYKIKVLPGGSGISSHSGAAQLNPSDTTVFVTGLGTQTMPHCAHVEGTSYTIINRASNAVSIVPQSPETIEGDSEGVNLAMDSSIVLFSRGGTDWAIV